MELIKEYIKVNMYIDFIEKEMNIKLNPYQRKIIKKKKIIYFIMKKHHVKMGQVLY